MAKTPVLKNNIPTRVLTVGFMLIIALLPIHAFLSTWLISNFGYPEIFKAWKEILLLLLLPVALYLIYADKELRKTIFKPTVNKIIFIYFGLNILLVLTSQNANEAEVVGLTYNLRFLAMFLLAQILVLKLDAKYIRDWAQKLLSVGILIVIGFGFLQFFILPDDFLRHFGYGVDTILPFQTIDQNSSFVRINSTLRGPNPLGLFMILVLSIVGSWWVKRPSWLKNRSWVLGAITIMSLVTLFASQSRSGWLGVGVALAVFAWLKFPKQRKVFASLLLGLIVAGFLIIGIFRNSDFIQNTVFHVDPGESTSINSSEAHWQASNKAVKDTIQHPLGQGPGSAGPASFYADQTKIAENYYLQIGQELGIVGLGLLLIIFWLVALNLYKQRKFLWPSLLLASFIGLNIASLFLHTWAQDEVAILWWGLAGTLLQNFKNNKLMS